MVEARGRGGASASPFSRHIYARSTSQTGPLLLFGEMLFHSEREAAQRVDRIERISDVSGGVRDCRATTRFAPHNLGSTGHPYRAQTERSPIAALRGYACAVSRGCGVSCSRCSISRASAIARTRPRIFALTGMRAAPVSNRSILHCGAKDLKVAAIGAQAFLEDHERHHPNEVVDAVTNSKALTALYEP